MGCVLTQYDEFGRKENAVYYLSKKFVDYESKYMMVEKLYGVFVWAIKQL